MPPKRTAASAKTATAEKKTAVKRKVAKKNEDSEVSEEEVENKKSKKEAVKKQPKEPAKASKRNKAPKEDSTDEEPEPVKKRQPKRKNAKDDSESEEETPATSTKTKAAPKTGRNKKAESESDEEESQPQKKPANKRTKKAEPEEEESASDDESTTVTKGRKKPAPSKATKSKNPTSTNWDEINFKCSTKNSKGKSSNFRITSWNVDGLRAWLKKGGLTLLEHDNPDILCFQETKCSDDKLPEEIKEVDGYETFWCSSEKEGYAGVGILSKIKPISVTYGIESEEHDNEGRCITAEYDKFFLVNVYVPNAGRKLVTLPKRLDWNELFKAHIKKLDETKPVIICGDMNVAHQEIDLANPKSNTKNAGFTAEERDGMTDFLQNGYVDTFRHLYPDEEKVYTFWTYMANARSRNVGWRLDYFLVSERLLEDVCDQVILKDILGSDHCPLTLHVNV